MYFSCAAQDGYRKFYYPSGKISSEGNFVNDKPDGTWKSYYENGVLKSEGDRKNTILEGVWKFYDEKGHQSSEHHYSNNILKDQNFQNISHHNPVKSGGHMCTCVWCSRPFLCCLLKILSH